MDYFISDTHFSHERILEFERWEFLSIEEHDQYIISKLSKLTKNDTLYHLGDFGYPSDSLLADWSKLKCKKIIILGNHDKRKSVLQPYFDEISAVPIFYKERILLSHHPLPVTKGTLNVHGHLHGAILADLENYLCVSAKLIRYIPISEKNIMKHLIKLKKDSNKFGEEWYFEYFKRIQPECTTVSKEQLTELAKADREKLSLK